MGPETGVVRVWDLDLMVEVEAEGVVVVGMVVVLWCAVGLGVEVGVVLGVEVVVDGEEEAPM